MDFSLSSEPATNCLRKSSRVRERRSSYDLPPAFGLCMKRAAILRQSGRAHALRSSSGSISSTGNPAASQPSSPPESGRTSGYPFSRSARATRAAEASFGHVQ
jgi:hypothetical protein